VNLSFLLSSFQYKKCRDTFKKSCFYEYKKISHQHTVKICNDNLERDCDKKDGDNVCSTEYVTGKGLFTQAISCAICMDIAMPFHVRFRVCFSFYSADMKSNLQFACKSHIILHMCKQPLKREDHETTLRRRGLRGLSSATLRPFA
jgi:hypothetical protein